MVTITEQAVLRPAMEVLPAVIGVAQRAAPAFSYESFRCILLQGVVEELHLNNTNYLTYNRVYSKIGATNIISADPAVIHFGGFEVGRVYKQILRIKNISGTGTRIQIITPTTPYFKALCNNKKGLVAPGLNEDIEVEFCPQQWRYYYDCIRIHSEDENLLVPIHAYPVMNEAKFPRRVDFGKCAIGKEYTKQFKIKCKVPIEFEYEILEVKPHPCFRVDGKRGIVPAHGQVTVFITFAPTALRTEEMQLEVRVSEFNSEPTICTVTGSALPGAAKQQVLQGATGTISPTMEELDGTATIKARSLKLAGNKGGGSAHGGAGGGDAFTNMVVSEQRQGGSQRDCRVTGPIGMKLPEQVPGPTEVQVDGVYLPDGLLLTQAEVAYVLNQQPGKLRIKDVQAAIDTKKLEVSAHKAALSEIMAQGMQGGVHPLERPEVPGHIKAALFEMQLEQAENDRKKVLLGSGVHVGKDIMSPEQIAHAQQLREDQHKQHQLGIELQAMQRLEAEMDSAGALTLPSASGSVGGLFEAPEAAYQPEWRLLEADDWRKRMLALDRFKAAVNRTVYGLRLRRNLARIKDFLAQVGYNKQRLAEESANPVLLVSELERPGTAPTKYFRPEMVRTRPLPLYRDVNFTYHGPVSTSHYTDFDELGPMQPKVPLEYKLLGYTPEEFPGLTVYTPPLLEQPLMQGAPEELVDITPSGVISPPIEQLPSMPDSCVQMPYVVLEIGNRYSDDKVYAPQQPSWGMDPAYALQPQILPFVDSLHHSPFSGGSVQALQGGPLRSETWLPRKDTWQMQLTNEFIPELMAGPHPADILQDSPDDADKPTLQVQVPTEEDIARYLPTCSDTGVVAMGSSISSSTSTQAGVATTNTSSSVTTTNTAAGTAGAADSTGRPMQDGPTFELMRQRRQADLDSRKRQAHLDAIKAFDDKIQSYNKTLRMPCHYALRL